MTNNILQITFTKKLKSNSKIKTIKMLILNKKLKNMITAEKYCQKK